MDKLPASASNSNWINSLRDFVGRSRDAAECCELCGDPLSASHQHLVEPGNMQVLCSCDACALLFDSPDARRYRRVPRDLRRLNGFRMTDADWDAFLIPINIAFFYRSSNLRRIVAMYPGPAGTTESTLDLAAWSELEASNPLLRELQEDVEALLVNRIQGAREYYRVPIDRCYELVGLIRSKWSGLSGGDGPRDAIQSFFGNLRDTTRDQGMS